MSTDGSMLEDTSATFHQDMAGSLCYMTSGLNAGLAREIAGGETHGDYPTLRVADGPFQTRTPVPTLVHTTPISTVEELQAITKTGNYYLTNDIDASATSGWNGGLGFIPLCDHDEDTEFQGTLDGCGYKITGLYMNSPNESIGLFAAIAGKDGVPAIIANLTLEDCTLYGEEASPFTPFINTHYYADDPIITNVIFYNCHVTGDSLVQAGGAGAGTFSGFVGEVFGWTNAWVAFYDCTTSATVNADSDTHISPTVEDCGGFAGDVNSIVTFNNCRATGNVTIHTSSGTGGFCAGGFVGLAQSSPDEEYYIDCAATGDVECDDYAGGFVGYAGDQVYSRCSARGDVLATRPYGTNVGGFGGALDSVSDMSFADCYAWGKVTGVGDSSLGSFSATLENGLTLTNCYAIGLITGGDEVGWGSRGGISGVTTVGPVTLTSCFWDTETTGETDAVGYISPGNTPLGTYAGHDTLWMKTKANYEAAGWDFNTVWEMPVAYQTADITEHTIRFVTPFPYEVKKGDRYCISGVPFKAWLWPLQDESVSRLNRWNLVGLLLKSYVLSGFVGNDNTYWRVSAFRNRKAELESTVDYPDVSSNPPDSAGALNIEGVDIVPYIEQIAAGVKFDLTAVEFNVSWTDSRRVTT